MDTLAQAQIELNKKYGGRLVAIAWTIEIIAASIGLFIGISSAISSIAYYQGLEGSDAMIGSTFTNTFIGAAPFIIIAAVELTKIPLALGFYRTKRLVWRLLFLVTLLLLVFVTFETMFNGLERNFSALESKIQEPRRQFQEQNSKLANINTALGEVNSRTVEQIDDDYLLKINAATEESRNRINELSDSRNQSIQKITDNKNSLLESYTSISDSRGTQQKVDRIRADIKKEEDDAIKLIQAENDRVNSQLEAVDIAIQKIEDNMTSELLNAGVFGKGSIRATAEEKTNQRIEEKQNITKAREAEISKIEAKRDAFVSSKRLELVKAEEELTKAQGKDSGDIEKGTSAYDKQIDSEYEYWGGLIAEENSSLDRRLKNLETEKAELKSLQRKRAESIPSLESERLTIRQEIVSLENQINAAARENNIYRITGRFYDHESAADIKVEELKVVTSIWFGSIAFIAAVVGAVLALAGFVLEDPESYKPVLHKKKPLRTALRGLLLRLRMFYRKRRTGVLRTTLRALLVDIRRWFRAPKIKYQKVKVPHEVIKEVPGPEKIVYTEVPKEVIKNEIVYVPLYSVEEGTVVKEKTLKPKKETDD
jgi:hypothetical protein